MTFRSASLTGAASALAAFTLSGCLTAGPNPEDPYEDFNRQMFAFNDGLDRAVLEHFQEDGPGWQDRINAALRKAAGMAGE